MKLKRNATGFAHYLIIILILVSAVIAFAGWHVTKQHPQNEVQLAKVDYIPGAITVAFKDAITYQQATQLINSYGLQIEHANEAETDFIPKSYRGIKTEKFMDVLNKLRSYPEVKSVFDDSSDPANNRAGPGEKWMEVIWQENVSFYRIKQIQTATNYSLSSQPQGITRTVFIDNVPVGQEDAYVKRLDKEVIVQQAGRLSKPVLLDCSSGPC